MTTAQVTPNPAVDDAQNEQLARQLYDSIMREIEPDLLTTNLDTLDAKYAGESEAQKAERMQRYQAAYAKFDEEFKAFMSEVNEEVRTSRRKARVEEEAKAKQSDQTALASIEAAFGG